MGEFGFFQETLNIQYAELLSTPFRLLLLIQKLDDTLLLFLAQSAIL